MTLQKFTFLNGFNFWRTSLILSLFLSLFFGSGMAQKIYADCSGYCQGQSGVRATYSVGHQCEGRDFCTYICTSSGFVKVNPTCVNGVETGKKETPAPVGGTKSCGDTCSTTADCRNPSANGSPVACINGTCQNTMCAAGMTIPGANCSCGANTRKCGQTCSGTVGLCGPGQGTCTYVNPPPHWYSNQPNCAWGSTAYCVGTQNGYSQRQCPAADTGDGGGFMAVAPNGGVTGMSVADLAKSCQVCGNGEVEIGEECDDGKLNGTATSTCVVGTCKRVACNKACITDTDCGATQRTVRFQLRSTGVGSDMLVDYILDSGRYVEGSPLLVPGGGTWNVNTDSAPHGGSYLHTTINGASVTYKTFAEKVTLRTYSGGPRGIIDVYVDGVLKQSITTLKTSIGWVDVQIPVGASNRFTCATVGAAKMCRLSADMTNATCQTQSPIATAAPIATSTPANACTMGVRWTSNANERVWKIGDMITFTMDGVPTSKIPAGSTVRYEGQVSVFRGAKQVSVGNLIPVNATASQFRPMKVEAVNATYSTRFRYCVKNVQNMEVCSAWGVWAAPMAK